MTYVGVERGGGGIPAHRKVSYYQPQLYSLYKRLEAKTNTLGCRNLQPHPLGIEGVATAT